MEHYIEAFDQQFTQLILIPLTVFLFLEWGKEEFLEIKIIMITSSSGENMFAEKLDVFVFCFDVLVQQRSLDVRWFHFVSFLPFFRFPPYHSVETHNQHECPDQTENQYNFY